MFPKSLIFVVLSALFLLSCDVNADLTVSSALCRELSGLQRFFEESPAPSTHKHTHKHPLTCYLPPPLPSSLKRQGVIDNHQRRRSQLQKLVEDAKVQLADHHSGRKLMETEEFEKIDKRVRLYEQKINRMGETLDEDVSTIVLTMITSKDAKFRVAEHICSCCFFFRLVNRCFHPRKSCERSSENNNEWNSVVDAVNSNKARISNKAHIIDDFLRLKKGIHYCGAKRKERAIGRTTGRIDLGVSHWSITSLF